MNIGDEVVVNIDGKLFTFKPGDVFKVTRDGQNYKIEREPCTPVYDVGSPIEYIKMRWGQDA